MIQLTFVALVQLARAAVLFNAPVFSTNHRRALSIADHATTVSSSKILAENLVSYFNPSTPGLLPTPYTWWQSAGVLNTMLRYQHYTGDTSYAQSITTSLTSQSGPNGDFMQANATGNDDQLWWGLTCMAATEFGFASPGDHPQWLQLAQNVFDQVSARWDSTTCNGGLGWQISPSAPGYHYKNAISNGLAFQLAARLARKTNDDKYVSFAEQVFDWSLSVGLVDKKTHAVYDGTDATIGCSRRDHNEWSYSVGVYLYGAAVMLQYTGDDDKWLPHIQAFIAAAQRDFASSSPANVLEEQCESRAEGCNTDQLSFKAYLVRWLSETATIVPQVRESVRKILDSSADGALESCNGSPGQDVCGMKWTIGKFDGVVGLGQEMNALEILLAGVVTGGYEKREVTWKNFVA